MVHVFLLKIVPPPMPAETRLQKVEDLVVHLFDRIQLVSFGSDSFQSKQMRQNLDVNLGLVDTCVSIDSTDVYHLSWLRDVSDGSCTVYPLDDLLVEVEEAVWNQKSRRVLRPNKGTDDLFQATVGSAELARRLSLSMSTVDGLRGFSSVCGSDVSRHASSLGFGLGVSDRDVRRVLRRFGRSDLLSGSSGSGDSDTLSLADRIRKRRGF